MELTDVSRALARFETATAAEIATRALLSRIDYKYIAPASEVATLVAELADHYVVLPVGSDHIATYRNLYFDTPERRSYHDHRCGRRVRCKVRIRSYPDRQLSFLELKARRNDQWTEKTRRAVAQASAALSRDDRGFLATGCTYTAELSPALEIDYRRVGLLNRTNQERVTLDFALAMRFADRHAEFPAAAIIEIKQPGRIMSPVVAALRARGWRPQSISKYAAGIALTHSVPCNRFLPALRALERNGR